MTKLLICFFAGGIIALLTKFIFAVFGFNSDGWYCGWYSCFFVCLFALFVNYSEVKND